MAKFYLSTSRGLVDELEREAQEMGLPKVQKDKGGVFFEGPWKMCYRAVLRSRLATRVLMPILDFPAYKEEELYNNVRKHEFTKYISPKQTFRIDAKLKDCALKDQRMLAMKTKDAIADQFTEKFGIRPNVEKDRPDLVVHIRGNKNKYSMAIDILGSSLSQRGYRKAMVDAPIREHVASGILKMMNWDENSPLVDPMCGSGTFLIEAALQALKVYPGTEKPKYSFQSFSSFQEDAWSEELDAALEGESEELPFMLYGFDKDYDCIKAAKINATKAGVDHLITFEKGRVEELMPPEGVEKGVIVTNPPYGIRLGDEFFLQELYKDMSFNFKSNFKGWDLWMISGNKELTQHLGMKAERRYPLYNGSLECRLLHYKIK